MIRSRNELLYYLACDRKALGKTGRPALFGDEIWKYEITMRKLDYWQGQRNLLKLFYRFRFHQLSLKLGFSIPCNVIGPGLAIVHYGTIVIAQGCRIGKNCRIHAGVNIGANAGKSEAATIGDKVYLGPGVKIIGPVTVGDGAVIGANAVVIDDVPAHVTVGGIPARIISEKDSSMHIPDTSTG